MSLNVSMPLLQKKSHHSRLCENKLQNCATTGSIKVSHHEQKKNLADTVSSEEKKKILY